MVLYSVDINLDMDSAVRRLFCYASSRFCVKLLRGRRCGKRGRALDGWVS